MQPTTPPNPSALRRSRLVLVAFGLAILASNVYFAANARAAAQAMEARVAKGDFAHMQLATGPAVITEDGRVYGAGAGKDPTGYVASTHLIPEGKYQAMLLADDGNPVHLAKAQLVIGAQDAKGTWFPKSAAAIAARLPH